MLPCEEPLKELRIFDLMNIYLMIGKEKWKLSPNSKESATWEEGIMFVFVS